MTADEFVAVLEGLADADTSGRNDIEEWSRVHSRPAAFAHPPDPVLDLIARYDVSAVKFWQLGFTTRTTPDGDELWHVADKSMDSYYVQNGQLLHMYYKADYPAATGLSSGQFLDVIGVYARMVAALPESPVGTPYSVFDDYANEAAAMAKPATGLDWFLESRRR